MTTFVIKDKNLVPENIKKGVTILKVTGTLEGGGPAPVLRNTSVDSSTVLQEVLPGEGYDGLSKVTVSPYELDSKTVDSSTVSQTVTSSKDGLSSVTVNPYTLDSKTVDASTVSQTVNSSADGLSSVTVNPYTLETDSSTLTDNGTYVFVPNHANGISQLTIDVSVEGSGSGDTWFVQAKRGEISDVSAYSFDGLEAMEYGAAYACAGSDIETYPELTFPVVANHGLEGAFRSCSELYNDDAVITINGSVGDYALGHIFAESHVNDVTIDVSTIGGEKAFENAFTNAVVDGDIVVTASEITNSFAYAFQGVNVNGDGRRWGTVSFPNLDTITGGYAFDQAFYNSYFETVSFPLLDTFEEYSIGQMFMGSYVGKLIAHPVMFCYDFEASPICDCNELTEIELSDTATNDMYFLWQPNLSPASVYSILSNLSDQDPHTVTFWGEYSYDEEQGEDVLVNNLKVYDYPDNRILGALNDAESAGWVINNLTVYPASSVDYITTGNSSTDTLELPGIPTSDTMLQLSATLTKSPRENSWWIQTTNNGTNFASFFTFASSSNRMVNAIGYNHEVYVSTDGFVNIGLHNNKYEVKTGSALDNGVRKAYLWNKTPNNNINEGFATSGTFNFVVNNAPLTLRVADWYSLKYWTGWTDPSTGGNSKVLVHDFVPVSYYNSVDDVTEYGLFDNVEAKFYTNSGITGASES